MKIKFLFLFFLWIPVAVSLFSQQPDKMMIVIIDGARHTETFGDSVHQFIPEMWELSSQGTVISEFRNDGITYTSRAIPALWCGAWTDIFDTVYNSSSTSYAKLPTIFEYFRKDKNAPADDCFYVLEFIQDLWLPSFDEDYGPDYWPQFHSEGSTDAELAEQTELVMDNYHPHFLWIYLADVDHAGHSGNWNEYTSAIQNADQVVGQLWDKIQSDSFYQNTTTLIVTNDNGRHDDQHGGFENHGCNCEGCRHIMFLALGPNVKENYTSSQSRVLPDMAVTASHILGINPSKSTGEVITEILNPNSVSDPEYMSMNFHLSAYPNPFDTNTKIHFTLSQTEEVSLSICNPEGIKVRTLINEMKFKGDYDILWDSRSYSGQIVNPGIYTCTLQSGINKQSIKLVKLSN